ncbi:MAG: hypothetical protein LCH37_09160 [Bacteroidetes bacterium]|nr:hypothetical protein [Bacteroidota bacterium]
MLEQQLDFIRSKVDVQKFARELEQSPELIPELLKILAQRKTRNSLYGSWALCHLSQINPKILYPFASQLLALFENSPHTGTNRNLMRCFMEIDLDESIQSPLFDYCLKFIEDKNQPVAVKAFSIETLLRLIKLQPELAVEVLPLIPKLNLLKSPGIQSTLRRVRETFRRLNIPIL